jgi:hypothetical protein
VTRYFCGECGSPTHITNSLHPESIIITNGTIDINVEDGKQEVDVSSGADDSTSKGTGVNGQAWRPIKEFHCDERAKWLPIVDGSEMLESM